MKHSCAHGANPAHRCRNSGSDAAQRTLGLFFVGGCQIPSPERGEAERFPAPGTSQQRCSAAHTARVAGHGRVDQQTGSNSSRKQKTAPAASSRLADGGESMCPCINVDPCPVATAQSPHTRRSLQLLLPWAPGSLGLVVPRQWWHLHICTHTCTQNTEPLAQESGQRWSLMRKQDRLWWSG